MLLFCYGRAFLLPLFQRRPEGIVQRVFGEVEVAEKADQGRQDPSRLQAVNGVHALAHLFGGVFFHFDKTRTSSVSPHS
jgi:hypothetical protein